MRVAPLRGDLRRERFGALLSMHGPVCWYCRRRMTVDELSVDHILPRALGGGHSFANLALACKECNQLKADHIDVGRTLLAFLASCSEMAPDVLGQLAESLVRLKHARAAYVVAAANPSAGGEQGPR